MDNEVMTIKQVAQYLQISPIQAVRFTKRSYNPLPTNRISDKTVRVLKSELVEWVERSCPDCGQEMGPILENSGMQDQPHWQSSGKLKCPNCGATK